MVSESSAASAAPADAAAASAGLSAIRRSSRCHTTVPASPGDSASDRIASGSGTVGGVDEWSSAPILDPGYGLSSQGPVGGGPGDRQTRTAGGRDCGDLSLEGRLASPPVDDVFKNRRRVDGGERRLFARLDRRADEVPPLGPRAVVVPDVVVAEQLVQEEPLDRRALADATVGDRRLVAVDAGVGVELAELVRALERPVLVQRRPDGDVARAGDVSAALRGLVEPLGRDDLAGELLGRAHVDHRDPLFDGLVDVVLVGADALEGAARLVLARREVGFLGRERVVVVDPVPLPAVDHADVVVTVVLVDPVAEQREPVGDATAAVDDDRRVGVDAALAVPGREVRLRDDVALRLVGEHLVPLEVQRARDVARFVRRVLRLVGDDRVVDLDEPMIGAVVSERVEVRFHPVRRDEYVFGHRRVVRSRRVLNVWYGWSLPWSLTP